MSTVLLHLAEVGQGPNVRDERLDLDHVATLRLALDELPPITVRLDGDRYRLVDGEHRKAAFQLEGRDKIEAVVVNASDVEAIEIAIAANRRHGKPFKVNEIESNARRLIRESDWSNARIAEACGLSDETVRRLRPRPTPNTGWQLDTVADECPPHGIERPTIGRDGKARPATASAAATNRERVRHLAAVKPDASNREIAREAGVSPSTVASALAEPAPLPPKPTLTVAAPPADEGVRVGDVLTTAPVPGRWQREPGFDSSNAARDLARFLDRRLVRDEEDVAVLADGCPAASRAAVAMVARATARDWALLADSLDQPVSLKEARK